MIIFTKNTGFVKFVTTSILTSISDVDSIHRFVSQRGSSHHLMIYILKLLVA